VNEFDFEVESKNALEADPTGLLVLDNWYDAESFGSNGYQAS
jgi:hypothetical protein